MLISKFFRYEREKKKRKIIEEKDSCAECGKEKKENEFQYYK